MTEATQKISLRHLRECIQCPYCDEEFFADNWVQDAIPSPMTLVCYNCDNGFSIRAKVEKVLWEIKKISPKL